MTIVARLAPFRPRVDQFISLVRTLTTDTYNSTTTRASRRDTLYGIGFIFLALSSPFFFFYANYHLS